jgi:hypothetical protein
MIAAVDVASGKIAGDLAYYRRRLGEEEARAFQARSQAAKAAHRHLALLYWEKIEQLEIARGCAQPAHRIESRLWPNDLSRNE